LDRVQAGGVADVAAWGLSCGGISSHGETIDRIGVRNVRVLRFGGTDVGLRVGEETGERCGAGCAAFERDNLLQVIFGDRPEE